MNDRHRGFTLIELMVAIVIVGILVAVALPAYQEQVRKGRRAEAKTALLKTMQLQERFYTASPNATYADKATTLYGIADDATKVYSGENPAVESWYELTVDRVGCGAETLQTCVRVVATPRAGYVDDNCNVLALNSRGVQSATGTKGVTYCWR